MFTQVATKAAATQEVSAEIEPVEELVLRVIEKSAKFASEKDVTKTVAHFSCQQVQSALVTALHTIQSVTQPELPKEMWRKLAAACKQAEIAANKAAEADARVSTLRQLIKKKRGVLEARAQ